MADTLRCPKCDFEIEVSTVLAAQVRQTLQREFEAEARQKDRSLALREENLRRKEQAVDLSRQTLEEEIRKRVALQSSQLVQDAESRVKDTIALEMKDLQEQLADSRSKLGQAQTAELQLRKERRDLETQQQELELSVNRRLDEERHRLRDEAKQEAQEENRLRDADQQKLIDDLRKQIGDLKRKAEQGSPQAQGEVMEVELEELLRHHFPIDVIEPVRVGAHGGDVLQHVHDGAGLECGIILWEAKRTKTWNDAWLPKLRDDQRLAKAHLAVLASVEMPKVFTTFGHIDGVWVTSRGCLLGLAAALRAGMLDVARTRRSLQGQHTRIESLTNYFAGPEFQQRIEGIVEAFRTMKEDLESEKRSMQRIWAKREKQLDRAATHTAGFYGDVSGILGDKLPQLSQLELAAITDDSLDPELAKAPWE